MLKAKNKRPFWLKMLFSLSSALIFLLFIEIVATFYVYFSGIKILVSSKSSQLDVHEQDFDTIFYNRRNARYLVDDHGRQTRVTINSVGFRDAREISTTKEIDEYRILCIGDSSTFGLNVDQANTYPAQLEYLLNHRKNTHHYFVINAGCSGFSSLNAKRVLETYGERVKPDLVIFSAGFNDPTTKGITDEEWDYRSGPLVFIRRIIFTSNTYEMLSSFINAQLLTRKKIKEISSQGFLTGLPTKLA